MPFARIRAVAVVTTLAIASLALASDDPRVERHELMEGVRDAAKPLGGMLRGDAAFDAGTVAKSLDTFEYAAAKFGSLFPEGTETGMDTQATMAVWDDREGFEAALLKFADAVDNAREAAPTSLEEAKPALGPIFQACKNCHDTYRKEQE